ncbi:MAG: hypothetical protein WBJ82_09675 [Tepidanaerobacteraceae bacterium]|nr:hypothetical protein [Tepidanaerobacter sp.]HQE06445.1 hypothetical protein [Tepidanaerobacteraceae bacterium]
MSALKEQAHKIIDLIPEDKMSKVLIILKEIKDIIDDEIDDFDLQLAKEAQKALANGEYVTFEEVLEEAGISEKDLQSNI